MRPKALLSAAVLTALALPAAALDYGSGWEIVISDPETSGVHANLWPMAERFARTVAEATGTRPAVRFAGQASAGGHKFYMGEAFAEKAGVLPSDMKGWSNGIAEKDGNVYFFGRDVPGRRWAKGEWPTYTKMVLPSARAMTRFLRRFAGVRFVMPDENGRAVPKLAKLTVPDGYADREDPEFDYMAGRTSTAFDDIARGHFGCGYYHTYGGHTYPVAVPIDRFSATHPEYFALSRDGRRTWGPTNGQTALCISNPEVEELILNEMLSRYDSGAEVCQLGTQDGSSHCWCEKCRALYGTGDDWCEKHWLFHRHLAERIERLRPGKIVHMLCYDITREPPKTFRKFPSNAMVELCGYREADFAKWRDYEVPHGFTVYVYFWGNYPQPGFVGRHSFAFLADNARRFLRNGVRGIFRCGYGDLYGLEGPGYYVFNGLMSDPEAPVDGLVAEYCKAAFGPASVPMQRFYDTQDERLRALDRIDEGFAASCGNGLGRYLKARTKNNGDLHAWAYSPDTIRALENCLAKAEKTAGLSDKEKRRIGLVRREFDYAKAMGMIGVLYGAYRLNPTQASFDALAEAILARKKAMLGLSDGKGGAIEFPGWPELKMLNGGGVWGGTYWLQWNGRLSATMGAPLNWDVEFMRKKGVLPGASFKTAEAARAAGAVDLDGYVANAGAWATAKAETLGGIQMEEVSIRTTFRVLYDDRNLYLGVTTDLPEKAVVREFDPDGQVWSTENLDLLLAPDRTVDVHYHLIWSSVRDSRLDYAFGLITEPLDPNYNQPDIRWNGKWRHEDRRVGDTWHSLVTIPYAAIGAEPPRAGDEWRLNLGRYANAAAGDTNERMSLWSPNMETRGLDNPDAMGRVLFK